MNTSDKITYFLIEFSNFPPFLKTFLSVKLPSLYYLPFQSAYYLTKSVAFYPVFRACSHSCQQTYQKKATTQVCVNIGIISNVYLQCCVGFRLIWVIELTFTHFYARLTAKVNIARWEEKDSSEHWHGGMSVQSVYTSEEPFCILPKYLQLTRNSIFLLQNNFPRLSRLF